MSSLCDCAGKRVVEGHPWYERSTNNRNKCYWKKEMIIWKGVLISGSTSTCSEAYVLSSSKIYG
jgi:hypothetical protein